MKLIWYTGKVIGFHDKLVFKKTTSVASGEFDPFLKPLGKPLLSSENLGSRSFQIWGQAHTIRDHLLTINVTELPGYVVVTPEWEFPSFFKYLGKEYQNGWSDQGVDKNHDTWYDRHHFDC